VLQQLELRGISARVSAVAALCSVAFFSKRAFDARQSFVDASCFMVGSMAGFW